jgi:hypothetical protein
MASALLDMAVNEVQRLRRSIRTYGDTWGTTGMERAASFPVDRILPNAEQWMFRGVDVDAPAAVTYRWLCQLRAAPYSYDWIDNFGRQSPKDLTPGLEDVKVGQRCMSIFEIVDVEPGESITAEAKGSVFGVVAVTYRVVPVGDTRSRIVAKLGIVYPAGIPGALMHDMLPAGDLVMMRKQLRNLAALAARDAAA